MTSRTESRGESEERDPCALPSPADATITPAMLQAGFAVLMRSGIADVYVDADKQVVVEIYRAMEGLRQGTSRTN